MDGFPKDQPLCLVLNFQGTHTRWAPTIIMIGVMGLLTYKCRFLKDHLPTTSSQNRAASVLLTLLPRYSS